MARAVIEVLDHPWPDGHEEELGLLAIDLDVHIDLLEKAGCARRGLYPCGDDEFPMVGETAAVAKRLGMSEDSYAYSIIRLKDAGMITLRVETEDEERPADPRGE